MRTEKYNPICQPHRLNISASLRTPIKQIYILSMVNSPNPYPIVNVPKLFLALIFKSQLIFLTIDKP